MNKFQDEKLFRVTSYGDTIQCIMINSGNMFLFICTLLFTNILKTHKYDVNHIILNAVCTYLLQRNKYIIKFL